MKLVKFNFTFSCSSYPLFPLSRPVGLPNLVYIDVILFKSAPVGRLTTCNFSWKVSEADPNELIPYTFVDLRRAFDTGNHVILLDKLEHNGARRIALEIFKSYLTYRKQHVSVKSVKQTLKNITISVP